jgi:DNA-binding response OmpR family regulator
VLISDVRMPGTDGLEAMHRLVREGFSFPVIVITAHADLDSAVAAYQGGAFEYLPKPFDVDDAIALVRRAARVGVPDFGRACRVGAAGIGDDRTCTGDAGSVPHHRTPFALQHDRADHRRIRELARSWWPVRCMNTARAPSNRSLH